MYFISSDNLNNFLELLKEKYEIFVPVKKENQLFYKKYTELCGTVIGEVRAFEPLKSFLFHAREVVAEDFKPDIPQSSNKPFAIVGVKACDLKGLKIQDHVFKNHDYQDPFYIKAREESLIISADCTCAIDTCFCLALGVKPYPEENFDINLSQADGGFIAEAGSERGKTIISKNTNLFKKAENNLISQKVAQRERVTKEVENFIMENNVPNQDLLKGVIEKKYESEIWSDEAKTCVECGACNTICPTCHCFLLYDQKDNNKMARLRIWDSCMIKDFARVAGGDNPRSKLFMRLRNRFEKKFDFFPKVAEVYACTGCGRCISACPAKIDIRKILHKLTSV